jgi:hypothetical protein
MVNGRVVVRDAEVLTLDAKQVITKAEEFGRKVRDSLSTGAAR